MKNSTNHNNNDIDLLMDEAKTMLSVGTYHDNIVNLQGISYDADYTTQHLKKVW